MHQRQRSSALWQSSVLFNQPSASGSTTPFLLAPSPGSISPNISQVSNENADAGPNSAVISWQFKEVAPEDPASLPPAVGEVPSA